MVTTAIKSIDSLRYERLLKRVNGLEEDMRRLDDAGFPEAYQRFRDRRRRGASLEELMCEVFALVREVSRRAVGIRQYDVQIKAGFALAEGKVLEMKTGEGKTFVTPLSAALYGLDRRGVHVLTANDYLAERDTDILRPVYSMLGLQVRNILSDTPPQERGGAYRADVTYTTVVQLGFDYLREYFQQDPESLRKHNMWQYLRSDIDGSTRESRCLRGRYYAIMDEVDSILIDYARRPLSLSVQADTQHPPELYSAVRSFVLNEFAEPQDFTLDRLAQSVELTESGKEKIGRFEDEYPHFGLLRGEWEERVKEAVHAELFMRKGSDYVVRDGAVVLVDQSSGRLMPGQRKGGELHQALEAKEGVEVQPRQTVAKKITVQSLIRPYRHLAGMTGTAWEARREFSQVYRMPVIKFNPRLRDRTRMRRLLAFDDPEQRLHAAAEEVAAEHEKGRPVIVGTRSVESSEALSGLLAKRGVEHELLNAVNHSREADIIAGAGRRGKVMVAANMAGRGVEIKTEEGIDEMGGMHVIGLECHTLSRLDRQLAGRTGRRGQAGSVTFFACVEDEVMKALTERELRRIKRRIAGREAAAAGKKVHGFIRSAQARYSNEYARMRKKLLLRDLSHEEGDKILFGQDRL